MEKSYSEEEIENILTEYKPLVLKLAKGYYSQGGDVEDLIQEGMIALYRSIFSFEEEKSSFQTYAYICISSRLKNVIKSRYAKSHRMLSDAGNIEDELEVSSGVSIEDEYIFKEEMRLFRAKLEDILSEKEFQVVELFSKSHSYEEIAEICNISKKSVDNALARAKRKIGATALPFAKEEECI